MGSERRHFCTRSDIELRAGTEGGPAPYGTVRGRLMVYGDHAYVQTPHFEGRERFEPGALRPPKGGKMVANVGHDAARPLAATPKSAEVAFSEDRVTAQFDLPDSPLGQETRAAVRQGVLDSFSIEFIAVRESIVEGVRVISDAVLTGFALVPTGAYMQATAEARGENKPAPDNSTLVRSGHRHYIGLL